MSLARSAFWSFLTRILCAAIGLGISILAARGLGPEYKGVYSFWCLIIGWTAISASFGLEGAGEYFVSTRKRQPDDVLNRLLAPFVINLVPLLIAGVAVTMLFPPAGGDGSRWYFGLISVLILLPYLAERYLITFVHGLKEFGLWNRLNLASSLLLLTGLGAGFLFLPTYSDEVGRAPHPGYTYLLLAFACYAASRFVTVLPAIGFLKRKYGLFRGMRPVWDSAYLRESLRYGLRYHLSTVLNLLMLRLDMAFVWFLLGEASVGVYSIAAMGAELLWHLPQALQMVLFPEIASAKTEEERARTRVVSRLSLTLTAAGASVGAILAGWVIPIFYGDAFAGAVTPFLILLPGVVLYSILVILQADLSARGRPGLAAKALVIATVINAILNAPLIMSLGIRGAALSTTLSYSAASVYLLWRYTRLVGTNWVELVVPRGDDFRKLFSAARRLTGLN